MKFTRGAETLEEGNKGPSMVAQHRTKLQQAKEEISMSKLKLLMPKMRESLLDIVLKETDWNVEEALSLLEGFMEAHGEEMEKVEREIRSREREVLREAGIEVDIERHSDDGRRERTKRRRGSHHHRRRQHASSEESSDEERKRRRRHRSKRHSRYGKYGIIKEHDMRDKWSEFALWASEIKGVKDVESMARSQEKDLFRLFMEDYNTATLPHKKYYDVERYERHKRRSAMEDGREKQRVFDDEGEKRLEVVKSREREKEQRLQEAYARLQSSDRAEDMRDQELLRAKMQLAYRTGDHETAKKLADKLRPEAQGYA